MAIVLYILFVLISLILILLVMLQDEQGEGLGGIFGGGSTTPFGSRSGNVLTRLTGALAAAFFVICLVVGLFNRSEERGAIKQETEAAQIQQKFFEPIKRDAPTAATPAPEKPAATVAPSPAKP